MTKNFLHPSLNEQNSFHLGGPQKQLQEIYLYGIHAPSKLVFEPGRSANLLRTRRAAADGHFGPMRRTNSAGGFYLNQRLVCVCVCVCVCLVNLNNMSRDLVAACCNCRFSQLVIRQFLRAGCGSLTDSVVQVSRFQGLDKKTSEDKSHDARVRSKGTPKGA